jgi:hypothetical protein
MPDITDPKVQRQIAEGPRYIYQPDTAEMEQQAKARSKQRARIRGAIEGQRYGAGNVPDLTEQGAGRRADLLQAPEGRPGHVPPEGRTDRRQGEFGKRIDTRTQEGWEKMHERAQARQGPRAPEITSPAVRGSEAKTPAEPYKGAGGVRIRAAGRAGAIGTAIFAALQAGEAGARELYEGAGLGEAGKEAAKAFKGAAPGVVQDLAEFTAADLAVTKVIPELASRTARSVGDAIARRTAQGTAGRQIANAILRNTGSALTPSKGVHGVTKMVGRAGLAGVILPSNIEAARTAAQYTQLPRQNREALAHAAQHKEGAERKYGTVERATRTRKGLDPDTGKRISIEEAGAFAEDILAESAAREKKEREKRLRDALRNRPRGT